MKHKSFRIVCVVLSLIIFISGIYFGYHYFFDNDVIDYGVSIGTCYIPTYHSTTQKSLKTQEDQHMNIIAIGNSDLYSAFQPLQLWHEQKLTSAILAEANTNMRTAYYILKESLKYQKPELIILEVDQFFEEKELNNEQRDFKIAHQYIDEVLIHNKAVKVKNKYLKLHGYYYKDHVVQYKKQFSYMQQTKYKAQVNKHVKTYLPQFVDLAKENQCQILFVSFPSASSWSYRKHNAVQEYPQQYGIPFIDFNTDTQLTDFNWLTDSRDGGNHLNYSGAKKMTKYLGEYLKEHYQFLEHQNEKDNQKWDKEYEDFLKIL